MWPASGAKPRLALLKRQRLAVRERDLQLDHVNAGDQLRHGVFDLQARVHLQEIEVVRRIDQELDGPDVLIADLLDRVTGDSRHLTATLFREHRRRAFFDHFLMPTLDAALTFAEMDHVALSIGSDLDLDVVAARDQPLEIQAAIAEMRLCFELRDRKYVRQLVGIARDAHAASTSAGDRFEHEREAQIARGGHRRFAIGQGLFGAWHDGHTSTAHQVARADLVAEGSDRGGARTNETDADVVAHFSKVGVLGQKPVARMNCISSGDLRCADDVGDVQVAAVAGRGSDANGFVRQQHAQRVAIGLRVGDDRADAHLLAGSDDAHGDLATIGDEDLLKQDDQAMTRPPSTFSTWPVM
jgi:hypothetical protein